MRNRVQLATIQPARGHYVTQGSSSQDLREVGEVFKQLQSRYPCQRVMLVTTEKVRFTLLSYMIPEVVLMQQL